MFFFYQFLSIFCTWIVTSRLNVNCKITLIFYLDTIKLDISCMVHTSEWSSLVCRFLLHLHLSSTLVLVGNGFHGELPPNIGDFKNLQVLTLARNNLSGKIPASLGALKKLKVLDLSHNKFKGCVPKQLGLLKFANEINLENNNLSGRITFSTRVGQKLKLTGNIGLCLGKKWSLRSTFGSKAFLFKYYSSFD